MSIPQDILKTVGDNPVEGAIAICRFALDHSKELSDWTEEIHGVLLEATAAIMSLEEHDLIANNNSHPDVEGHMGYVCNNMTRFLQDSLADFVGQSSAKKLEALKKSFGISLANGFAYEFTDGDLNRIQEIINELRDLLKKDSALDDGHKRRLLKRLEELQKELNKKVSSLSHFYILMGDFGVAIGKLGKDSKPFTDRIGELLDFAWKAQARAEQLPSSAENPMLGHDGEPPRLE
ncbi:hypothetical protein PSH70_18485 [Pseudomonas fluorescens]|uniref:hypothetical protein n=1 Tax=Pseudomonas fluorescens TaxID=294 RepID=UPI0027344D54|nr:hypothetical protein [Pseudomonas fluorescens]WLH71963.1 hypothetical protein PSH70_18485 [Pseudomonas fluorescens]